MVKISIGRHSWSRSFKKMFERGSDKQTAHSPHSDHGNDTNTALPPVGFCRITKSDCLEGKAPKLLEKDVQPLEMELMKERYAKLLLGEDMSGGGKGVSSALALSNAITNLAASVFGKQTRLEPMCWERRERWRKEMGWLLAPAAHIVEFVPSLHHTKDGEPTEIMVTKQRADLVMSIPALQKLDTMLLDTLENFKDQKEFWYVSTDSEAMENGKNQRRKDDKWWLPTVKVPPDGLPEESRRWIYKQKDSVSQVLKAAMAINAQLLSEMDVPESYIESLPKNGKTSLGDLMYKSIREEWFDPLQFLSALDLSTDHKVVELEDRIEASIVIWKRKMNQKDSKTSWASTVTPERRELFEERAETILVLLKQQFPGIPQSALDVSKIQYNKDVGQAIVESYSRILESLAFTVRSRIEDVLEADSLVRKSSRAESEGDLETETQKSVSAETVNSKRLSDFMGWNLGSETEEGDLKTDPECYAKGLNDKAKLESPSRTPKRFSYLEKLEILRSPVERH